MKLLDPDNFATTVNGQNVGLFTLENRNGLVAQFTNYGARLVSLWVPDRSGNRRDVVLGFDGISGYLEASEPYHGATIGRVCGRINNGQFTLNEKQYILSGNDMFGEPQNNHLHGGERGFHTRVWEKQRSAVTSGDRSVTFTYSSPDGEEEYPGSLETTVIYRLTDENEIIIEFEAVTDNLTIVNLTNHAYFNLKGEGSGNILDHVLTVHADHYLERDKELIPTGHIVPVDKTPLDFRTPTILNPQIHVEHYQVFTHKGFATAYVLSRQQHPSLQKIATLFSSDSGIKLEVLSDLPSLQFYNGWLFDGADTGKQGDVYDFCAGLALEAQHYPDAPNHLSFPSIALSPDETYNHTIIYRFTNQ